MSIAQTHPEQEHGHIPAAAYPQTDRRKGHERVVKGHERVLRGHKRVVKRNERTAKGHEKGAKGRERSVM